MHLYFSGIGGTGIGPLALIARQVGYDVSGSDKQDSGYISYLRTKGIEDIHIGQTADNIKNVQERHSIDWAVFSSAVFFENESHPELDFARQNSIRTSKRDEFIKHILKENGLKLIAIAGTHGKTTTTAMMIWLMGRLEPISYSVGAKIPFGDMGHFDKKSRYFIYECDEFDKNFLAFHPYISLITGIDWDHHEVYPTKKSYRDAFEQFMGQSELNVIWQSDTDKTAGGDNNHEILDDKDRLINTLSLPGEVNLRDAFQVIKAAQKLTGKPWDKLARTMNEFPGVSRRFEKITGNLYSDYAHTIPKIKGCLQLAREVSDSIVVVYEPLTNRRQHFIQNEYKSLFKGVKKLYWVPSYLAREDPAQQVIQPEEFIEAIQQPQEKEPAALDEKLKESIRKHLDLGDTVVCLSGGGGGSLDEWVRKEFE
jgi:UDP-N-acetylmuramate--alanine ligase